MKPYDVQLDERLRDLPNLSQVLGKHWIEREQDISPIESAFPLARTLRIEELRHLIVTLDRLLGSLASVQGSKDWRSRLRNNGQEFRETLTELVFAGLLQELGYTFVHPDKGPDFAINIDDGPPFQVEVTTPRIVGWADDLDGRLWFLSRRYDHSLRMEPLADHSPILDENIRELTMRKIVEDSREQLEMAPPQGAQIERDWPEIGLKIIWKPNKEPRFRGYNSPHSSHVKAFNYIAHAAQVKSAQLRKAQAHTLVIGTNMLPFPEWEQYVTSLRNRVPFYGHFDWTQIPEQVRYLVLFLASYGDNKSPAVDVLVRPEYRSNVPDEIDQFLEQLRLAGENYHRERAENERVLVTQLTRYEAEQRQLALD